MKRLLIAIAVLSLTVGCAGSGEVRTDKEPTHSLELAPTGMTIDPRTGLIKWPSKVKPTAHPVLIYGTAPMRWIGPGLEPKPVFDATIDESVWKELRSKK